MSLGSALHLKSSPSPTPGTEQYGGKARRCLFPCCDGEGKQANEKFTHFFFLKSILNSWV